MAKKTEKKNNGLRGQQAATAALFHMQMEKYHREAGRTEVADQHADARAKIVGTLKDQYLSMYKLGLRFVRPWDGEDTVEFVDYKAPEPAGKDRKYVSFGLSEELKGKLEKKAADNGKNVSEFLHGLVSQAV